LNDSSTTPGKAYIVPTLQMNVVNYREDEETFLAMIRSVLDGDKAMVRLGTGYLNL